MIVTSIYPVTGSKLTDLDNHPFVVETNGMAKLKIYVESENSRRAYLTAYPNEPDHCEDDQTHYS